MRPCRESTATFVKPTAVPAAKAVTGELQLGGACMLALGAEYWQCRREREPGKTSGRANRKYTKRLRDERYAEADGALPNL